MKPLSLLAAAGLLATGLASGQAQAPTPEVRTTVANTLYTAETGIIRDIPFARRVGNQQRAIGAAFNHYTEGGMNSTEADAFYGMLREVMETPEGLSPSETRQYDKIVRGFTSRVIQETPGLPEDISTSAQQYLGNRRGRPISG